MITPPDDTTADPHAVIATLRTERDAALAENVRLTRALAERTATLATRNNEYGERIEQQAASIEVLKAMSATAGDAQPVLDLIARRARELCDAETVGIFAFDGEMISLRCIDSIDMRSLDPYLRTFPRAPTRDYTIGRAVLDRQIIEIDDADADPNLAAVVHQHRNRSIITLPFLVDDRVAGGMSIAIRKPGGLTDSQKALARTLAEQAVIAIGSTETYRALQTRTADLQESLEYQTATSSVLKVISRSTFDLQPVLTTVVETAAQLCDADQAMIVRREGESVWLAANRGFPPEYEAAAKALGVFPLDRHTPAVAHRALIEGCPIHIHDVTAVPGYPELPIRLGKQRTSLGVPLLREGVPIGVILLARQRVEPFTDQQIALVSTFADQAVIAIENARLLTEQREALEQQTAMAEVLQVINQSPGSLEPVFETLLERAMRLCGAHFGELHTFDDERFRAAAFHGVPAALIEFRQRSTAISVPGPTTQRMRDGATVLHIADMMAEDAYRDGDPHRRAMVDLGGARTVLAVALRKDDKLLGAINIYRREVRPFDDGQVTLLQNFAAQAVIAMENARLITEQREALERQTATAEVLQVINASPGDLVPVFDALLERALRLCGASFGTLLTYDGENIERLRSGRPSAFIEYSQRNALTKGAALISRGIATGRPVQATDVTTDDPPGDFPSVRDALVNWRCPRAPRFRCSRTQAVVGFIAVFRREPGAFSGTQIAVWRLRRAGGDRDGKRAADRQSSARHWSSRPHRPRCCR